jgi:membrane protease YdiL (CAAX protease family)
MKRLQRFSMLHPLAFVILATVAWIAIAGLAAWLATRLLHTSPVGALALSLGTLTATACVLLLMRSWRWLRPAGVTVLGGWRLWLVTAGLAIYIIISYQLAFFGRVALKPAMLWAGGQPGVHLLRSAMAGSAEEILFRGFLLYALVRAWGGTRCGRLAAVSVPALIFGLTHAIQALGGNSAEATLMTMVSSVVSGLWWGALVLLGGSLWPAVLIHTAANASVQIVVASLGGFEAGLADYALATAAGLPLAIGAPGLLMWRAGSRSRSIGDSTRYGMGWS